MPVGTQLSVLRTMLNAECGEEMDETISPGLVASNNQLLNNQQAFLDNQHTYLRGKTVVSLAAVVGQQYYDVPAGIDFDRLEEPTFTNVSNFRYRIQYGIGQEEYNLFRSDLGVKASPVMRWQMVNIPALQIELWPIPSVPQSIIYTGLLPLAPMVADTDTCVIDDLVLVLFTAAELLARKGSGDAQAKAAKAKAALDSLKASFPSKFDTFNLAGQTPHYDGFYKGNNRRPVVAVNN
ncbi:MAG: hypothetical protein KGL39_15665 [Patescibacteria group bacterium]|nr:hypothetical protein [Patescibacteria group bacterium]